MSVLVQDYKIISVAGAPLNLIVRILKILYIVEPIVI